MLGTIMDMIASQQLNGVLWYIRCEKEPGNSVIRSRTRRRHNHALAQRKLRSYASATLSRMHVGILMELIPHFTRLFFSLWIFLLRVHQAIVFIITFFLFPLCRFWVGWN